MSDILILIALLACIVFIVSGKAKKYAKSIG